ncbi:LarC family nickel insertion protein [Mesorhizobium captivum]|uniref:LarC family nickel insertion protein n=1 Tax=Mesorhizobium captivum TaxID=3072319 RepID=UPI002A23FA49|nr:LarC family nickel insertion protein [Mesorhizobium sp. VK23E]MDX8514681.1 LarC family nickel insertion protein [Mesorhizobium sp. VK23E]
MHVHLDVLGGIAGDMFVAAMLDAWPDLAETVQENLRLAGLQDDVEAVVRSHNDGVLTGSRFDVTKMGSVQEAARSHASHHAHGHAHEHDDHDERHGQHHHEHVRDEHHGHHNHTHWRDLRAMLEGSRLDEAVKRAAIAIFHELALAEAAVHGRHVDDVAFHEVGNWDSIADIVAAATLIEAVGEASWSVGSLPLGRGWVKTDHGRLPVPAPATTLLLRGFTFHDDGRPGERITPTGAAILRYLSPSSGIGSSPHVLDRTGIGFGTRRFPGMSNMLRVQAFTNEAAVQERIGVIQFEIDDQTGEEMAVALDHIRAAEGVIDVIQSPVFGKKGRMMASVQVLTRPDAIEAIGALCFRQTTTLGLRSRTEARTILPRQAVTTSDGMRVKIADRPGGPTAKAEMDDLQALRQSHKARSELRRCAEAEALEKSHDHH